MESYGVLVGWTHSEFNGRLDLNMQATKSAQQGGPGEVEAHHFLMTKNQAVVLANYLFNVTNQPPPHRHKRGFLRRFLGS